MFSDRYKYRYAKKNIKSQYFKKLNKKEIIFRMKFNGEDKRHSIVVAETQHSSFICWIIVF